MVNLLFGELQGRDINGIIAYSCYNPKRDDDSYIYLDKEFKQKIYCGIKWQCIEYVRRWLILMFGISFEQIKQAYMLYKHAKFYDIKTNKQLKHYRHSCLSKSVPHVGSLIIWNKDDKQYTGHVAVVTKVNGENVYICEQNWTFEKWPSNYSRKMILKTQTKHGVNRHYLDSNDPTDNTILGWLSVKV